MDELIRRLERLEKELTRRPAPPSPEEVRRRDLRRDELVAAALEGRRPVPDLTEGERDLFEKTTRYAPVAWELAEEGLLDGPFDENELDHDEHAEPPWQQT